MSTYIIYKLFNKNTSVLLCIDTFLGDFLIDKRIYDRISSIFQRDMNRQK